jgi:hypothetical protein
VIPLNTHTLWSWLQTVAVPVQAHKSAAELSVSAVLIGHITNLAEFCRNPGRILLASSKICFDCDGLENR